MGRFGILKPIFRSKLRTIGLVLIVVSLVIIMVTQHSLGATMMLYWEWLKSTRWDGKLPPVTGGSGQGVTPFIEIPTSRSEVEAEPTQGLSGNVTGGPDASSFILNGRSMSQQQ